MLTKRVTSCASNPPAKKQAGNPPDANTIDEHERSSIYAVAGLDRKIETEVIVKSDFLEVCINPRRTLITRSAPSFTGDRLFLFAQNGGAIFESIEVKPLVRTVAP